MKIKNLILSVLAGSFALLTSCMPEETLINRLDGIDLGSTYITIAKGQSSASTTMTIEESWTSSVPEWLTLDPSSGAPGKYTLNFIAKADSLDQGEVKIIFGGKTQKIKVIRDGDKPKPVGVLFEEPFVGHGQGDFEIKDITGSPWSYDAKYGMKATAYINGANTDAESYLISPEIDLTDEKVAILTFEDAVNYMNGNPIEDYLSVEVTSDNGSSWEKVTVPNWPAGSGWDFVRSGDVDLSKFVGKKIKFAFHYKSNTAASPTWEIQNVKLSNAVDTTPELICSKTEVTVAAAATSASFAIEAYNLKGGWSVTTDAGWITEYTKSGTESGPIDVKFEANTNTEERTATFTVSAEGVEDVVLTLTQEAFSEIVDATAAEINAQPDSDTPPFRIKGVVTAIDMDKNDNTKYNAYGNFYISDETGTVYVYGLLPEAGGESKQDVLTNKGIKVGDVITVVGPKSSYNGNPQMKNVYYESHIPVTTTTTVNFNSLADGDDLYLIKGTIRNIVMDKNDPTKYNKYGNFDVVDEAGSTYVYGIVPMGSGQGGQDILTTRDVKEGDIVTVVGPKSSYNGNPQMKNGFLVSVEPGSGPGPDTFDYTPGAAYKASNNIWKSVDEANAARYFLYLNPDWAGAIYDNVSTTDCPYGGLNQSTYKLTFENATTGRWQNQVFIHPQEGHFVPLSADKTYKFSVSLQSDASFDAFFKLAQYNPDAAPKYEGAAIWEPEGDGTPSNVFFEAGKPIVFEKEFTGVDAPNVNLIFDFGGNPAGATVYIKDIILVEEGAEPVEPKVVTVAEFLAAPESDTQVYQLTGTIGGSINTTYGNFDLTDETGSVYVYGLTATELGYGAKNDKSFASLGLNEGDKIVMKGYRGSYGDKIEVMYGWFVEKVSGGAPAGNITIDGDMSDWAGIEAGLSSEEGPYLEFKATNDDEFIYLYSKRTWHDGLWKDSSGGYYYFEFDTDNDSSTGTTDVNGNTGFGVEAWMYLYLFTGTAAAPTFASNPAGSGYPSSAVIENILSAGFTDMTNIETEVRIPLANIGVAKGQTIKIYTWGNKSAGNLKGEDSYLLYDVK